MKRLLIALFVLMGSGAAAQPATEDMVGAERGFAARSMAQGMRAAFLHYSDTGSVMFENGQPVNGYQLWLGREKRPGFLNWKPVLSELATSGDWGFTAGPWTFQNRSAKDTVAARGHFFTVWKKDASGNWRFLFDYGIETVKEPQTALFSFQPPRRPGPQTTLIDTERAFSAKFRESPENAHQQYLSVSSALVRKGHPIAFLPGQQQRWLRGLPTGIDSKYLGHLLSPSRDLAVTYGNLFVNGKPEIWVRVWRHEPSGWRLAFEMLPL